MPSNSEQGAVIPFAADNIEQIRIGDWLLDLNNSTLSHQHTCEKLPNKVFQLLLVLAQAKGDIVTIEQLTEQVWDGNVYTSKRGIVNNISKLRALFAHSGDEQYIENIPKCGYRLLVPVIPILPQRQPFNYSESQLQQMRLYRWPSAIVLVLVGILVLQLLISVDEEPNTLLQLKPLKMTKLFDNQVRDDGADITADGTEILFSRKSGNYWQIFWQMHEQDSSNPVLVSNTKGNNLSPRFIGNNRIAYLNITDTGECRVITQSLVEKTQQRLANCHSSKRLLKYHKSANQLVFFDDENPRQLVQYDLALSAEVTQPNLNLGAYTELATARNSKRIVGVIGDKQSSKLVDINTKQPLVKHSGQISDVQFVYEDRFILYGVKTHDGRSAIYLTDTASAQSWAITTPRLNPKRPSVTDNAEVIFSDEQALEKLQRLNLDDASLSRYEPYAKLNSIFAPSYHQNSDRLFFLQHNQQSVDGSYQLMTSGRRFDKLRPLQTGPLYPGLSSTPLCDLTCQQFVYSTPDGNNTALYLYDLSLDRQTLLDTYSWAVTPIAWLSRYQLLISMSSPNKQDSGLFEIDLQHNDIMPTKLSDAIPGKGCFDPVSKRLTYSSPVQDGIWQIDWRGKSQHQLVADFNKADYKNFFCNNDILIYVSRQGDNNTIVKHRFSRPQTDKRYPMPSITLNKHGFTAIDHASSLIFGSTHIYSTLWSLQLPKPPKS